MTLEKRKAWKNLVFGLIGIYLFVFCLIPLITQHSATAPVFDLVREQGIDSGALFYTESEKADEAAFALRKKGL